MAQIYTYAEAVANLREWTNALQATSSGSSYSIGGRTLTRQDTETIRAEMQRWHNTVVALEAKRAGKTRPLGATAAFEAPGSGGRHGIMPGEVWTDWRT